MIENAQLIGLSRQIALQHQMDVVANNMANINTTGFKAETLLHEEYVMPVARERDFAGADQSLSYTQDWASIHDMTGGAIVQTGNTFDIALNGNGFLTVQTPSGERYTRAGDLKVDNTGLLVTVDGDPVMSEGGQIRFSPAETDIRFNGDGSIITSAGNKGRLKIVDFENPQTLARVGDNLFDGPGARQDLVTKVQQGAIEKSNVTGVAEMAEMIRVSRAYETIANLLQQQSELRQSAIHTLGNLAA